MCNTASFIVRGVGLILLVNNLVSLEAISGEIHVSDNTKSTTILRKGNSYNSPITHCKNAQILLLCLKPCQVMTFVVQDMRTQEVPFQEKKHSSLLDVVISHYSCKDVNMAQLKTKLLQRIVL